jgi:hypothetical protein
MAERVHASANPHSWSRREQVVVLVLVGFLLVFPKGGIKLAGVPITWGYLALGLVFTVFVLTTLLGAAAPVRRVRLTTLAMLIPFQMISWLTFLINGVSGWGFAISFLVTFFFVPVVFVLALGVQIDRIDLTYLFRLIRYGVFAVAIYGIFLFFFRLGTGRFIEIPLLTVNLGDVGGLEDKYIDRGGIFKLISTYNNGNIYGICILLLLPLYCWLERSLVRTTVVKASLVLTLSRTVWLGLLLFELLNRLVVRRPTISNLAALGVSIGALALGLWYAMGLLGVDVGFLLDRQLGGRARQWMELESARLVSDTPFETVLEIVYLSMLHNFGIVGLAAFVVGLAAPLGLYLLGALPQAGTEYKRALAVALAIYLVVALSDGAILYIPVMAFYWFVVSLLLSDNPTFSPAIASQRSDLTLGETMARPRKTKLLLR